MWPSIFRPSPHESIQVLEAGDREQALHLLPGLVAERGPIYALIIRMPIWPYAPYDEGLLGSLVPGCEIVTTASAGYDRFDVDWMTKNNIWFCNTVDAVAEATADMAIFLILAVLRDTTRGDAGVRKGTWKEGLVPCRDPSGLTLGIVGMGSIGKVCSERSFECACLTPTAFSKEGPGLQSQYSIS